MSEARNLLAALALVAASCTTTTTNPDVASRLDAFVTDLHNRGLFDGAVVVGDDRRILWEKGFGYANVEQRIPTMPRSVSSLSFPYDRITLRHLLSHSSGLPVADYDYFDPFLPPPGIRTTEALLGVIAAQRPPLAFEPGTAFEYSSYGFDLAALAARAPRTEPMASFSRSAISVRSGSRRPFFARDVSAAFPAFERSGTGEPMERSP